MRPSTFQDTTTQKNQKEEMKETVNEEEVEQLEQSLPQVNWMGSKIQLIRIQESWYSFNNFSNIHTFQKHFVAKDTDLFVTSFPKTGTTWLKSLLYSVVNRSLYPPNKTPLLSHNPHELVYDLETAVYGGNPKFPRPHQLDDLPSPRLLHSHLSYASLPKSIKTSAGKMLYICRNPLDTLVSHWHFYPNLIKRITGDEDYQPPDIQDFFEEFCQGTIFCGPFFEHVLGYWKQSLEEPNKILFLKYEDLKENPSFYLKKIAEFIGMPFSPQEEEEGVIKQIIDLCDINNLKELEVNKSGLLSKMVENKVFFRDGKVGGWSRYITAPMVDRMNKIMEQQLGGTGLSFKLQPE
ncbi:cytosolic sulfotransferase 5-like [Beta vulgaris subsp. vulgaris]|uniref:cytosolic sulfotransferase 5-like n=1 Tax=Beta vulgaris subsp. vulgaris TaxID=3555 RepID=UPI00053FC884|nr:cytosolic sulfotransferase 5-like [Beta vulgaris subsp. vulgaris]